MKILKPLYLLLAVTYYFNLAHAQEASWYPSKWGADDEIGSANYLSPDKVLEAAKLVTKGKVYRLGIPVGPDTPAYPPRKLAITILQPNQGNSTAIANNKFNYLDDMITGWVGMGTQLDGLGHAGIGNVFYNGHKVEDFGKVTGLEKLGVDKVPPIVTRGVLLNIAQLKGVERLGPKEAITRDDLMAAEKAQGVKIREGDVVIIHTGWLSLMEEDPKTFGASEPGINADAARYLVEKGVVAVGGDNWALEVIPTDDGNFAEVHQILLAQNGTYILENLDTRELVKDNVSEFLFVLGQPLFKGAVQSMINPVAIR